MIRILQLPNAVTPPCKSLMQPTHGYKSTLVRIPVHTRAFSLGFYFTFPDSHQPGLRSDTAAGINPWIPPHSRRYIGTSGQE